MRPPPPASGGGTHRGMVMSALAYCSSMSGPCDAHQPLPGPGLVKTLIINDHIDSIHVTGG